MREIGNGGETALHLNGHGGDGDLTMGGMRKERIVVSGDEIAMRIQRKMEYVAKFKTDVGLREIKFTFWRNFL